MAVLLFAAGCDRDSAACRDEERGVICAWAGSGNAGFNGDGLHRRESWFSFPMSVTFSDLGPPVIADWNNHKLRVVEDDHLRTVMGTDFLGDGDAALADMTPEGAVGTDVNLNHPTQQQYLPDGRLLSASWHTHKLRTWDPATGRVHVLLGKGAGFDPASAEDPTAEVPAADVLLNQPSHVEVGPDGQIYILDMRNERVRRLDMNAMTVTVIAGSGEKGYCGEGSALETCFNFPKNANPEPGGSLALDPEANLLYVADTENHAIRVIDLGSGETRLLAGVPGEAGDSDGPGETARFNLPTSLARFGDTLYVADPNNHKVRQIDLLTGEVSTFAGNGAPTCAAPMLICEAQLSSGDGELATEASLYRPFGVDVDGEGRVYISDTYNHRIRVVTP
jgi:DNA-binding beta-propeller fold protein YncE